MNSTEKHFLWAMDEVANTKEQWLDGGPITYGRLSPIHFSASEVASVIEDRLKAAGRVLGLNTRWHVTAGSFPRRLTFVPKNGQSNRMLQFYEQLYIERELSDGFGHDED